MERQKNTTTEIESQIVTFAEKMAQDFRQEEKGHKLPNNTQNEKQIKTAMFVKGDDGVYKIKNATSSTNQAMTSSPSSASISTKRGKATSDQQQHYQQDTSKDTPKKTTTPRTGDTVTKSEEEIPVDMTVTTEESQQNTNITTYHSSLVKPEGGNNHSFITFAFSGMKFGLIKQTQHDGFDTCGRQKLYPYKWRNTALGLKDFLKIRSILAKKGL